MREALPMTSPLPAPGASPDFFPARMLNEFAYCARLCYLEWVQGEFSDSVHMVEGRFHHRSVDHAHQCQKPATAEAKYEQDQVVIIDLGPSEGREVKEVHAIGRPVVS